ncbi:IS1 transposase [Beggiatoa sp. PS]|nr:IS1 transposase [Beggiatoa sp. PS]
MNCPHCQSNEIVKNGSLTNGKQKYKCKVCGRQFVINPQKQTISEETKALVDKLLLERISLAGIVRATGVSKRWLQDYVNEKYDNIPRRVKITRKSKGRLTIECDELWSFVSNKNHKKWVWLAIDRNTREIVFEAKVFWRKTLASKGVYVGDRSRQSLPALWESLPGVYRQCAVSYTDFWEAYETVFPSTRHRPVGKETGQTNHVERLNCTLRQRISRLVRKTLSFSKKLSNHIGAIWNFVHHYNAVLVT